MDDRCVSLPQLKTEVPGSKYEVILKSRLSIGIFSAIPGPHFCPNIQMCGHDSDRFLVSPGAEGILAV